MITVIYKDLNFFVRDAWGESDLRPQAEGLRQGDPLACFLLLILMTVIMLDTRKAFEAICTEKNFSAAAHYMERVFGFHKIEFADDTNLKFCTYTPLEPSNSDDVLFERSPYLRLPSQQ